MRTKHRTLALLLTGLSLLTGCKKGGEAPLPEVYQIGEDSAPALVLPEEGGKLSKVLKTTVENMDSGDEEDNTETDQTEDQEKDGAKEDGKNDQDSEEEDREDKKEDKKEKDNAVEVVSLTYTYVELDEPGGLVASYADLLTGEENGFLMVDGELKECDSPDFTVSMGAVTLAKETEEAGRLFSIAVEWQEEECVVTVSRPEGEIVTKEEAEAAEAEAELDSITLREAVDYLKGLTPSDLGLTGSSMAAYQVYAMTGTVMVGEDPCMRLNVYTKENPEKTNELLGSYLLTGDKRHLYRCNLEGESVTELVP